MSNEYILQTRHLTKKYKKSTILNGVSINVRKNTVYGLLGPNGAGKSTTLKIISGLLKQTSGEVIFNGNQWTRKDLIYIGSLIENAPLYGNLTAIENLEVINTILGLPKERIQEVLQVVGLTNTGSKKVMNFSMGMKQRLGIALAILNRPKLLILDEPTNGLDPIGIQELRELIASFPKQGMTVLLSSHLLSEVEHLADDIGIISNGILGYEGKYHSYDNLENLFTDVVRKHRAQ
ncbi:lantibiotic ABC transporter ATP-binding protein [Bacillus paralicheniformis]|uniref:lantibiotic protection ABC transporter ATP-binding protein n=1 Tax=Bacillus paralicheniformis TaxID=1648923 RepID=UPI00080DE821|nr:lantibiotic protection ABC transporter ATP-binding protein [Bacillus paralicheniformis]PRS14338.1 lantibiotic ABC transporter ATP-binding protein [Bacillus paralicheniformis]TAI50019.1 lantibiotic ABC transporter ATP-binding protein [Bacillus paralicheniformis]TWK85390.1 putative ABC transporter ATP-binding protein YxlF [Bacillus paralicheniformis]